MYFLKIFEEWMNDPGIMGARMGWTICLFCFLFHQWWYDDIGQCLNEICLIWLGDVICCVDNDF